MTTLSEVVKAALSGNSGITNLVNTRIYPLKLPQPPTYEAISYQRISNTEQVGTTALRESRWQINCWAETYGETQVLAAAVKAALEEFTDTNQVPRIKMSRVVNETDDYDDSAKVYRTIVDVMLTTTGD